jgi:guanine deaminase
VSILETSGAANVAVLAMNSDAAQVFVGTIVHTPSLGSLEILHDHVLVLDPKGFIAELLPRDKAASYLALPSVTTLPAGCFLLPSFVDLHLHAPQYLYLGNGLHLPLMQWLDQYAFKAEERLDNDPILAKRVYEKLALRLKEGGTGAVLLFGTIKEETKYASTNSSKLGDKTHIV